MAELYVANGSHQRLLFQYRVPAEAVRIREILIPPGRQVKFNEDFDETQLASVVEQLERYGAVPVKEIGTIIYPRSLVYSVSRKAISSDAINAAREADEKARQEVAAEQTEKAGLSLLAIAESAGPPVESTSLEVVELQSHDPNLGLGERQDRQRRGVDVEITVSKKLRGKTTTKRRGD